MIHRVDIVMAREIERFALAHTCDRCASFDPVTGRCSLEYPNEPHLPRPIAVGEELTFCKEFELT